MRLEERQSLCGVVEVNEVYQTVGHKGQAPGGGSRPLGRWPRGRGKKRGRRHGSAAKDARALVEMVSRQ